MIPADFLYITDGETGRPLLRAMPLMLGVLGILAIAYRYYSAFLAAKVAAFDDTRVTPAHTFEDGSNFHPTNRWVLFGHHFAAISGAGPLIGPVLAMQYGFAPGLLWIIVGVCLAGAVQDMMVLAVSVRTGGRSLAEIAKRELGPTASLLATAAILFIVIIALAGLALVIVKALGGEEGKLPAGMTITVPGAEVARFDEGTSLVHFPPGCSIRYAANDWKTIRTESFKVKVPSVVEPGRGGRNYTLPAGCAQVNPGSSWGTFTIACTIPIALFVGLYMNRLRRERIVEASLIGGALVLGAVVLGAFIPGSSLEPYFALSRHGTLLALCIYGFVAAVLPIWLLLTPRDYLSSFLKLGTLALLVVGIVVANPVLRHPPLNAVFQSGGPTFAGGIFPFVFICVMCGSISGFHALVASGTTPKMVNRESDIRGIGYGAMLCEGLVGVVALISAAALSPEMYYAINVGAADTQKYQGQLKQVDELYGTHDPLHAVGARSLHEMTLGEMETQVGGESLRGRTGGAVTLAVSMAIILTDAFRWADIEVASLMKYWYHFAIMFEALFILTTIDAGTRIARYLFQEAFGRVIPSLGSPKSLTGSLLATLLVTAGWGTLVATGEIGTIWPMFGIANQLLAVLALSLVSTYLIQNGKTKYAWVTILPMIFVTVTTLSAGKLMIALQYFRIQTKVDPTINALNIGLTIFVILLVCSMLVFAISRWIAVLWLAPKKTEIGLKSPANPGCAAESGCYPSGSLKH